MQKRIWLIAFGAVGVLQFIQPDRSAPVVDPAMDLLAVTKPSAGTEHLLRVACYDCHGATTTYPWYSHVTPVNFWLQSHINDAREGFDLSQWGAKSPKWRNHKKQEAVDELSKGDMPLPSYTWMHSTAKLTTAQRDSLMGFFAGLQ
jgi:Haem-binding domain